MDPKAFDPSSLLTRASLLIRLRDRGDNKAWQEFDGLYRQFVYGLARRSGLNHAESEDVVQEVLHHVSERIEEYQTRSNCGAFRRWLMNQTRWRIADKFRERGRPSGAYNSASISTPAVEDLPSPCELDQDQTWEAEWQRLIFATALERLAQRVPAKQFQAFDLSSRQGWPTQKVARELGLHAAAVYLHNHRLTKQLRREVERLRKTFE